MIQSSAVLTESGMTVDDEFKVMKTYMDTIRSNKTVSNVTLANSVNLFSINTFLTNGQEVEIELPDQLQHNWGNGLIGLGDYGITLSPGNIYHFKLKLLTTCDYDALIEVGYYYRNADNPTSTEHHNATRKIINALRNGDGSYYRPDPIIMTKNKVVTEFESFFDVNASSGETPWHNEVVPYLIAEFPDFATSRLVMQGWNLLIRSYPKWAS